jgi:hypothetical protein
MHTTLKQYPGFDLPQTMRGDNIEYRGGDGTDVEDDEDGAKDVMDMLPYSNKESVVMMAAISLR